MSEDRERLRQLRLRSLLLQEEARVKALERAGKRLAESQESWEWIGGYQDVVDRLRGPERDLVLPVSTAADRRYGANWPFWRTWVEHSRLRASARLICTLSTLADGALQGLTSYVIGEGFTFRATSKDTAPDDLLAAVQDCIDDFDDANCFDELQQELFVRDRRDGEFFLRSFDDDYGTMLVRTVEPEQVLEPVGQDPEVHSFGIFNERADLQQVTAYHVALDGNAGNGEEVPADEIVHSKVNVDRLVKRGLTDFCFDTYDQLKSASRLLENMTEGAAIQASIALLRQHEGTSSAGVSEFIGSIADYEQFNGVTGRTEKVERFYPGKIVDAPKGMTVQTPSFGANAPNFVAIVQAVLRSVAVKWNAPEWLVSGDASNNNYSSSITAESPFVKTCKRRQKYYKRRFLEVIWRAIKLRCDAGLLRAQGRAWSYREVKALVTIQAEAPTLETRNKQEEASTNTQYIQAKVKSVQTVQQELGLDSEQEAVNIKEWDEQFGQEGGGLPMPGDPGSEPQPGEDPLAQPPGMVESITGRFYLTEARDGLVAKVITNKLGRKQTVWVKGPAATPTPKPAAKKAAGAAKPGTLSLDDGRALLQGLSQGADVAEVGAKLAELHMTDLQTIKKDLKLKVGGTKVEQAKAAARAAIAAAKGTAKAPTPAPVTKPSSAPAPAAKPTPAVKPAAKPVAKQADGQEVATGHPAIDGPVAAAKTPAAKVSALFDASSYFADLAVVGHMKDPNSVMQHMVSAALEGQPASVLKEAAKAVGISKPTGDVRSQIAKQMHERLQQAIRARDTIFGEKSDQADAVKRLHQHGYDVAKGAAKGVSVPKFEPVKKVIPSPKPPKAGFTGTDNLGRRWENGKLVAAKEDPASPPEQRAMGKVLASPVTKVDELRDHLGLGKEEFDALIIKLADQGQLVLSQDANPAAFTPAQRAKFVQDGDSLITAVMPSDDARAGKPPKPAPAQPATPAPAPAPAPAPTPTPQAALPIGAPHPASTGKHADGSAVRLPDGTLFAGMVRSEYSKPNPALPDSSRPVLTGAQANAVYDYTSWAYEDVNRALRAGVTGLTANINGLVSGSFAKVEKGLAEAFAATPMLTPPPVEVHRGMNFRVHEDLGKFMKPLLAAVKTGGEVTLAGYSSTTTDPTAATNFLGTTPRAVHMKIKAVHGLDAGPYSPHPAEKELLLDHNSRFRVISVTPAPHNSYTVELEQVPTDKMLPAPATGSGPVPTPTPAGKPTPASVPATGQSAAPPPKKKKKGLFSKLLSW